MEMCVDEQMKRGELILLWTGTLLSTALPILDQDPIFTMSKTLMLT